MLPLAAVSVLVTPLAVRLIERFGVRTPMIVGALALAAASGALGLLTVSFWPPLVLVLTALMGVPYGVVMMLVMLGPSAVVFVLAVMWRIS